MNRVKNVNEGILKPDAVFGIVHVIKTGSIILPNSSRDKTDNIDYIKVVKVGSGVTDIDSGDIVLDISGEISGYTIKGVSYAIISRGNIKFAVKKDNFNVSGEEKADLSV